MNRYRSLGVVSGNFPEETCERNFCSTSPFPAFSNSCSADGTSDKNYSRTGLVSLLPTDGIKVPISDFSVSSVSEISKRLNSFCYVVQVAHA